MKRVIKERGEEERRKPQKAEKKKNEADDVPEMWSSNSSLFQLEKLKKKRNALKQEEKEMEVEMRKVLANDEIKDGLSERGGHPVEQKLMKQWSLRITAYADRLLEDLSDLDKIPFIVEWYYFN